MDTCQQHVNLCGNASVYIPVEPKHVITRTFGCTNGKTHVDSFSDDAARDKLIEFANLLHFGYCCGLRGKEIVKVDVSGFLKYLVTGGEHVECPHVVVPLLGRLKGETGERYHMMILAWLTASGLEPEKVGR